LDDEGLLDKGLEGTDDDDEGLDAKEDEDEVEGRVTLTMAWADPKAFFASHL
jgi:hypothetical protein